MPPSRFLRCALGRFAFRLEWRLVTRLRSRTDFMLFRILPCFLLLECSLAVADEPVSFNRDIRPILSDACFFCHGPDAEHREADLRLDIESNAKESAITPGDLSSELIARLTADDEDLLMPPPESGKQLTKLN